MAHYYDEKPEGDVVEENFRDKVLGKVFSFTAASGLFSKHRLDYATKVLIERCELGGAKKVLDLGSGWGPVSTVLASIYKDIEFVAVDVNRRAVMYTRKNIDRLRLKNVRVFQSDVFERIGDELFDLILTNPPYSAGRDLCFRFISESKDHLTKGGSLQLVARHNKGGKVLMQKMEEVFGNVSTLAKKGGFHVYKSVNE